MKRFSAPPALNRQSSHTAGLCDTLTHSLTSTSISTATSHGKASTHQHRQAYIHHHKQQQLQREQEQEYPQPHQHQNYYLYEQQQHQKQKCHAVQNQHPDNQHQQNHSQLHHKTHRHRHQQHNHHQHLYQPQHHQQQHLDSIGKRVRTEQTFESLFDKETHSDVTINVNSDEYVFHAHRIILEMKSDVFTRMLSKLDNKPDIEITVSTGRSDVPVLRVEEDAQCSQVFARFLYFLYSSSVWLHQDYVLPLFRLADKYGVKCLREHCQGYILQVLAKSCKSSFPSNQPYGNHVNHNHSPSSILLNSPNSVSPPYMGNGFNIEVVCDLYEDEIFAGDIRQTAYRLLCCQFREIVRTERWLRCSVKTVCSLISGDNCNVEENIILVSSTDYMKRNNLADKKQIEEILSLIRYPRLDRRVLYHLQKNGSFNNFPHIQDLMLKAMMYHSFKDLPETKDDFVGPQFRPRMSNNLSPNRRASMQVATVADSDPEDVMFMDSAYSLDPTTPVTLAVSRQSQV